MPKVVYATREIGIDMAHRVPDHGSKCRNLHGHRYTVHATIGGDLATDGEERGMVMDFGFLKELMMLHIDERCDHGLCLWVRDPIVSKLVGPSYRSIRRTVEAGGDCNIKATTTLNALGAGKLLLIDRTPTAENLAALWFSWLEGPVEVRSGGRAKLMSLKVWETPNCSAEYVSYGEG